MISASYVSRPLGVLTIAMSGYEALNDVAHGDYKSAGIHGLDAFMAGVTTFGGQIGAGIGTIYFISRFFWGNKE